VAVDYFDFQNKVLGAITLVLLAVKLWALVDAITRPEQAFRAADKQTKPFWLWVLVFAFAASLLGHAYPLTIFSLIGTVAAFVYLLDVKPALAAITRRR
jgi:predicted CDP-diglyceride synthetase/phosphatidate cytidylyltransferase